MQQSAQSLKHRVRTAVFPWLAEGLLCDRRGRLGCDCAPTEAELADVFQAGRTLLYRLLFLAFGEARQLLPVSQTAYRAFSLRKLAEEIAGRAGSDPARATRRIEAAYSADDYQLYGRLCRLLAIVAPGDPAMDVPKFPGTLFGRAGERSTATPSARSLSGPGHRRTHPALRPGRRRVGMG